MSSELLETMTREASSIDDNSVAKITSYAVMASDGAVVMIRVLVTIALDIVYQLMSYDGFFATERLDRAAKALALAVS
jgi:hypothetical protein